MTSKWSRIVNEFRKIEEEINSANYSNKIEAVLRHIWSRGVITAPKNYYRKGYIIFLIMTPLSPLIDLFFFVVFRNKKLTNIIKSIAMMPLSFLVAIFEIVTDGYMTRRVAKKWIHINQESYFENRSSILWNLIVMPAWVLMRDPYKSQSDSISALQSENSPEAREELLLIIEIYWRSKQ